MANQRTAMLPTWPKTTPRSTLGFAEEAAVFKGPTRNARVLSEGWVAAHAFCTSCGATPLTAFAAMVTLRFHHHSFLLELEVSLVRLPLFYG
ncbi:MAG: hypothetical protein JHC99_18035 [Brevundimonas sp.]|nr:hypothetical protein [Brevundimonas sp.]